MACSPTASPLAIWVTASLGEEWGAELWVIWTPAVPARGRYSPRSCTEVGVVGVAAVPCGSLAGGGGAQGPLPGTQFSGGGLRGWWLRTRSSGAGPHVPSTPGLERGGRRQAQGWVAGASRRTTVRPVPWMEWRSILASPPRARSQTPAAWERPCSSTPSISAPTSVRIEGKRAFSGYVSRPSARPSAATAPPASSVAPGTSSRSIQFTAATVLSGGSLDLSSIRVMVTMALPTAFSTRLLQELPQKPFPRPRFGLKSLSDPTRQLFLKWLKGAQDAGTWCRGAQPECPGLSVFSLEEI